MKKKLNKTIHIKTANSNEHWCQKMLILKIYYTLFVKNKHT